MAKYNLTEKSVKPAAYRALVKPELQDQLYEQIMRKLIVEKIYKNPDYTAKQLAADLETNTRYISAVVNLRFGKNYTGLINEYRVKDAMFMLTDKRFCDINVEDIGLMVGFANRQSFYSAFFREVGRTPRQYRLDPKAK
ncbi:MAG: AraC family transcriptional regulator [Bacteroidaceae bacterium]|nr:AraC family transcriptional regulator [Bacteroidaceae bacterium]